MNLHNFFLGDKKCQGISGSCDNGNCENIDGQTKCVCKEGFVKDRNNYCASKSSFI